MSGNRVRDLLLTIAVTSTSHVCLVPDRLMRRIPWNGRAGTAGSGTSRHSIPGKKQGLDAVLVRPGSGNALASVLVCHGIGETVEHWHLVQQMLAESGVASLVFDYSGYGRSPGFFSAHQAEEDAVAAYRFLVRITAPLPVSILGLSLGSGIASAIVGKVRAHRLVRGFYFFAGGFGESRSASRLPDCCALYLGGRGGSA